MDQWRDYAPAGVFGSTWTDGVEALLSNYVSPNFQLVASGANVTLTAGAGDAAVMAMIRGKPRWITANLTLAFSGAAAQYDLYATTAVDSFGTVAGPPVHEVDNTDHSFQLVSVAPGATPSGTGSQALYRRVGAAWWDGVSTVTVVNLVGPRAGRHIVPVVPRLPSPVVDGQEVDYQVDADTLWRFRFNAAGSRWDFAGGPWWRPASGVALGTVQVDSTLASPDGTPSLTPPLAGTYDIYFAAQVWASQAAAFYSSIMVQQGATLLGQASASESVAPLLVRFLSRQLQNQVLTTAGPLYMRYSPYFAANHIYNVSLREIMIQPVSIPVASFHLA